MTILKAQVASVLDRRPHYLKAERYYEGSVGEVFVSAGLSRAFRETNSAGQLNFCRPIVDAVYNRLEIAAVVGTSDAANAVIGQTWEFNQLGLDSDEIHRRTGVYGDCYVMVWPDAEGENVEISYNTPLTTSIVYDPESPRTKLYAVKMWEVEDEHGGETRLNIYYPDRIEKYRTQGTSVTDGVQWALIESAENPFGEIPVFHFRTERPFGRPEHADAFDSQDYINKQFVTSMLVTEYQATPQRYALTRADVDGTAPDNFEDGDTDRENMGALQSGPGKVWFMENIEKVGEFKAADPDNFWNPIKDTVRAMASTTNTPLHYFEKTGNVPSGEALRVAEAPLIKKVDRRKASYGQTWRELFKFVLRAFGLDEDVQIKWKDVESLDELERLDAAMKKRTIGISLEQTLREAGYDEEVITRIMEEADRNRAEGQVTAYPNGAEKTNDQTNATEVVE